MFDTCMKALRKEVCVSASVCLHLWCVWGGGVCGGGCVWGVCGVVVCGAHACQHV